VDSGFSRTLSPPTREASAKVEILQKQEGMREISRDGNTEGGQEAIPS